METPNISISLHPGHYDAVEKVTTVLSKTKAQNQDYYVYERAERWYLGIGRQSSLVVSPDGQKATICSGETQEEHVITGSIADEARQFLLKYGTHGHSSRSFGYAGFNYAAHTRGLAYRPGKWPLLSLMVPRTEVIFGSDEITLTGSDNQEIMDLCLVIDHGDTGTVTSRPPQTISINTEDTAGEYTGLVEKALGEISQGKYTKVIPSRRIELPGKLDMPATLLQGRRGNDPARTFSLSCSGFLATGFSPELVMSMKQGKVITEPLAGTRSCKGTDEEVNALRQDLLSDPKEVTEHVLSVREALDELHRLCLRETVVVEDLMSVRPRGSVQHLGSRVVGHLSEDKDAWDAFDVLFPSITASGIPKQPALEAIERLEPHPRELYSGAVLMIEGPEHFEAALVLRSVFQDDECQWAQAGAGVIAQSKPERELMETREKLESVVPFLVQEKRE